MIDPTGTRDSTEGFRNRISQLKNGETWVIEPGDYKIADPKGLTIEGLSRIRVSGYGVTFHAEEGVSYEDKVLGRPMMFVSKCVDSRFEGMNFKNEADTSSVSAFGVNGSIRCIAYDMQARGFSYRGQFLETGCSLMLWERMYAGFSRSRCRGMWLGNAPANHRTHGTRVLNCVAEHNDHTGIVVFAPMSKALCNVSENNQGAGLITPSDVNYQIYGAQVSYNTLRFNQFWGWQSDVTGSPNVERLPYLLDISHNISEGNGEGGYLCSHMRDSDLVNNNSQGEGRFGMFVTGIHNVMIRSGSHVGAKDVGLRLTQNPDTASTGVTIAYLKIQDAPRGIDIQITNPGGTIRGVDIIHNRVKSPTPLFLANNKGDGQDVFVDRNKFGQGATRITGFKNALWGRNKYDPAKATFDEGVRFLEAA